MRRNKRKGFVNIAELVVLSVLTGIIAIVILNSTTKSMQTNFDTGTKTKIQRDLWSNQ